MQVRQTNECTCADEAEVALVVQRAQNIGEGETLLEGPTVNGLVVTFVVQADVSLS